MSRVYTGLMIIDDDGNHIYSCVDGTIGEMSFSGIRVVRDREFKGMRIARFAQSKGTPTVYSIIKED